MKIPTLRFEVAQSKAKAWFWFQQTAKAHPTHRVQWVGGLEVHSVETEDLDEAISVYRMISHLGNFLMFVGCVPIRPTTFGSILWKTEGRPLKIKRILRTILDQESEEEEEGNPMKIPPIRFEVGKSRSDSWLFFMRHAQRHKSYRIEHGDHLETHIIETNDLEEAIFFWGIVAHWKKLAIFLANKHIGQSEFAERLWQTKDRPREIKYMLESIIREKQKEREEREGSDP